MDGPELGRIRVAVKGEGYEPRMHNLAATLSVELDAARAQDSLTRRLMSSVQVRHPFLLLPFSFFNLLPGPAFAPVLDPPPTVVQTALWCCSERPSGNARYHGLIC